MCNLCPILAAKAERLEAENANLKAELYGQSWEAPREIGLTNMEAVMLQVLVASDRVRTPAFLIEATRSVPSCKKDFPSGKLIEAKICHIRRKLAPYGLKIETQWGHGFRLADESRARLRNWNKPAEDIAA